MLPESFLITQWVFIALQILLKYTLQVSLSHVFLAIQKCQTDTDNHRILEYNPSTLQIQLVAGTGEPGYGGDGNLAIHAQLNRPYSVYYDKSDDFLLIADTGNHRIRKITKDGIINTIVGTGIAGFNGDSLHPLNTHLNSPQYATSKRIGILISDTLNHRVRIVPYTNASTVSTLVGLGSSGSTIVENNPRQTELNSPSGIEVIRNGFFFYDIYIAGMLFHSSLIQFSFVHYCFSNRFIKSSNSPGEISKCETRFSRFFDS